MTTYYSETKVAFHEQLSWLCFLSEATSNAVLGTANRLGKCNDELKLLLKSIKYLKILTLR